MYNKINLYYKESDHHHWHTSSGDRLVFKIICCAMWNKKIGSIAGASNRDI